MTNDFETVRDDDEPELNRADLEEPDTWMPETASPASAEVDDADWADQQVPVDDSPFDEDGSS